MTSQSDRIPQTSAWTDDELVRIGGRVTVTARPRHRRPSSTAGELEAP